MNLPDFLAELFAEGRVAVPRPGEFERSELISTERVLQDFEAIYREELPEGAPKLDLAAAIWGAGQFYRACQLAMFRDVGEEAIAKISQYELESWEREDAHYSVDLTFRFLPDLMRMVQSVATDDPLVELLMNWGRRWPLSSIGTKGIGDVDLGPIARSPSLMLMYVDRVLAREDLERLGMAPVRRSVQHALGLYGELAPKVTEALSCQTGEL